MTIQQDPFGRYISFEGKSLTRLRQYIQNECPGDGNLVLAHICNSSGNMYYVYADGVEMKIPTLEQFEYLKAYIGKIPEGYNSKTLIDFVKEYVQDSLEWLIIDERGETIDDVNSNGK